MRYKRYLNILFLIAFFSLVFHVTFNSRNTKLKNFVSSLGFVRYSNRPSCRLQGYVLCFLRVLEIRDEINKL